ncbi:hypothetical protein EV700_2751 [Fluviicoccus keumensis]|uniref:Small ligand-binding sensory domain FIST n=1 Tax=Fluviicoccus keumensis TaxID=1435465 RepID=A0A4Q7YMW6_9GAMM|nr:FIST N-terminal domain-containing protein [Fluviicoccus keumensis]RZU38173.1 hypothetical protein EV700_2751 [Fluviicoccus keumensis]
MKALSAATQIPDPYRAGADLGDALKALRPEVVFLFSTIDLANGPLLLEGLRDALELPDCLIIGNSGDGLYSPEGCSEFGAVALGLNSGGAVRWQLSVGRRVTTDPVAATREAMRAQQGASLAFLISDFHADASLVESVLEHEVDFPVIGGFAADDQQWHQCALYANSEVLSDCVVALGAHGPIRFGIHVENTISPVGQPGIVEAASGTRIDTISGIPAMQFIERETGKPVLRSDRGITSLTLTDHGPEPLKRLRAIAQDIGQSKQSLQLYGGIREGQQVQVCMANPEQIVREVDRVAAEAAAAGELQPVAALIISCAGRKSLLGSAVQREVEAVKRCLPGLPLAGFPSLGEIAPLRRSGGYSPNLFHNMTYVLLLIGS